MKRRLNPGLGILLCLLMLLVVAAFFFLGPHGRRPGTTALQPTATGTVNILIIGKDARAVGPVRNEGRQRNKREAESHSDIVIVCHINFALPALNLVAIPRDLLVEVPGHTAAASNTDFTNMDKLAHTYAIGGEKLLRRTVEHLLGIRIQRSIAFDFDSFRMAFDALRPFVGILRIGTVTLTDRNQALRFARKRYGLQFDDADRCRNAVGLVRAVMTRTWWLANTRLGDMLISRLMRIVGEDTDLTRDEIVQIVNGLRSARFRPSLVRTAVLVSTGAEVTLNRYHATLSCYLPAHYEIEKQADYFLRDKLDVRAIDFMTQQPFRVPAYFDYNYVTAIDSSALVPAESPPADTFDSINKKKPEPPAPDTAR
jgi:LCP family protein required for cell wall assembly